MAHKNLQHTNILITLDSLAFPVITLATLEETTAPVVSCYLNLERGASKYRHLHEGFMRRFYMIQEIRHVLREKISEKVESKNSTPLSVYTAAKLGIYLE